MKYEKKFIWFEAKQNDVYEVFCKKKNTVLSFVFHASLF